jgi:hypothetical protein
MSSRGVDRTISQMLLKPDDGKPSFMARAAITCGCIDSWNSDRPYDGSQHTNDSDSETMMQNSLYGAPPDVVIPESDKISESDASNMYQGVSTEQESEASSLYPGIGMNPMNPQTPFLPPTSISPISTPQPNWSATATMEEIVRAEGPQVNDQTFQVFVNEMIKDKCWGEEDYKEFIQSMQTIKTLTDAHTDVDKMGLIMNPKYFNAIHDILDKLDTVNVICAFGTGNKCAMITDPKNRDLMRQQVETIGKLVDVYTPVFVRMMLLMEKITGDLSQEQSCNLDPAYLATIKMIKERVVGTLYMRKIQDGDWVSQNKSLRDMSNGVRDSQILPEQISAQYNQVNQNIQSNQNSESNYEYLFLFLFFVVIFAVILMVLSV